MRAASSSAAGAAPPFLAQSDATSSTRARWVVTAASVVVACSVAQTTRAEVVDHDTLLSSRSQAPSAHPRPRRSLHLLFCCCRTQRVALTGPRCLPTSCPAPPRCPCGPCSRLSVLHDCPGPLHSRRPSSRRPRPSPCSRARYSCACAAPSRRPPSLGRGSHSSLHVPHQQWSLTRAAQTQS